MSLKRNVLEFSSPDNDSSAVNAHGAVKAIRDFLIEDGLFIVTRENYPVNSSGVPTVGTTSSINFNVATNLFCELQHIASGHYICLVTANVNSSSGSSDPGFYYMRSVGIYLFSKFRTSPDTMSSSSNAIGSVYISGIKSTKTLKSVDEYGGIYIIGTNCAIFSGALKSSTVLGYADAPFVGGAYVQANSVSGILNLSNISVMPLINQTSSTTVTASSFISSRIPASIDPEQPDSLIPLATTGGTHIADGFYRLITTMSGMTVGDIIESNGRYFIMLSEQAVCREIFL